MEIDDDRAPLIRRMFEMRAEGHSAPVIARIINKEGHRTLKGIEWQPQRIRYILSNPLYSGRLVVNRGRKGERRIVQGDWPALVPPEVFDRLKTPALKRGPGALRRAARSPSTSSRGATAAAGRCSRRRAPTSVRTGRATGATCARRRGSAHATRPASTPRAWTRRWSSASSTCSLTSRRGRQNSLAERASTAVAPRRS
jgi:hypothetical protein